MDADSRCGIVVVVLMQRLHKSPYRDLMSLHVASTEHTRGSDLNILVFSDMGSIKAL